MEKAEIRNLKFERSLKVEYRNRSEAFGPRNLDLFRASDFGSRSSFCFESRLSNELVTHRCAGPLRIERDELEKTNGILACAKAEGGGQLAFGFDDAWPILTLRQT